MFKNIPFWFGLAAKDTYTQQMKTQAETDALYTDHISAFSKSYATQEEYLFRKAIFEARDTYINDWNLKEGQTHKLGHNEYSDWTDMELQRLRGTPKIPSDETHLQSAKKFDVSNLADSVDWRTKGAMNPVQNQRVCGAGWAFSAIAAMEGEHFIKTGKLLKLSEQQCVDCADEADGCLGGYQTDCFDYAKQDEALDLEADYPFVGQSGSCWSKTGGPVGVSSYQTVLKNSASQLKAAIAKQPVAVNISSTKYEFVHYMSGIITSTTCGTAMDHGVVAVGYGVENGQEYYIIRNSWGAYWGENGHLRVAITGNDAGICGVQGRAVMPATN